MDLGISGKVALVTAGSKGLGRASAAALAAEGAKVVICARTEEPLRATEAAIRSDGGEVHAIIADVTDPAAPARLVAEAEERYGSLDILVANAGGPPPGRALDLTDDQIDAAVNANLTTSVRLVREAVPGHASRRLGSHLLHHLVVDQAADARAVAFQPGPHRPVGVGQDGRLRPLPVRDNPEPDLSRVPTPPTACCSWVDPGSWVTLPTSVGSSPSSAHSRRGSSRARH